MTTRPARRATVLALATFCTAFAAGGLSCGSSAPVGDGRRMVVLGFDGLDPRLVRQGIADGALPHFARAAARSGVLDLQTTHAVESPTAWASFATGTNPGKHDVFGFIVRDPATYLPDLGLVHTTPGRYLFDLFPVAPPRVTGRRSGTPFWVHASRAGLRARVLTVPVTYPPEDLPRGELLSGLPLPDLRGTVGTFSYYATDLPVHDEGGSEVGGLLRRLVFDGDTAVTVLQGPPDPIVRQQLERLDASGDPPAATDRRRRVLRASAFASVPLRVRWQRGRATATVMLGDESVTVQRGGWTRWMRVEFRVNPFVRFRGLVQACLLEAGDELRLYVSPVNWDPEDPPLPMSSPEGLAAALARRLGPYGTLGWAEPTWALDEERIDEDAFMHDAFRAFDERAQIVLDRLAASGWDLLVGVVESPDRVQHVMWRLTDPQHPRHDAALAARHGDAIRRIYRRADQLLAEVLDRLDPDVPLLVVSDHGFHSWRRSVNLNTWLVAEGYLALQDGRTSTPGQFWAGVDWRRTRAYAVGLGQIYVNLRGRERDGIVMPGAAYRALVDELAASLRTLEDPSSGAPIVQAVHRRDDIYSGAFRDAAPDLQVGLAEGYRVSWQTSLGGAPEELVYDNRRKWSGDHASNAREITPGTLISTVAPARPHAAIVDIAPTVLKYFGIPVPEDMDGTPLF